MGLYRERGIVLRTIKLGEADRIVTLVTEGHGKLRAVAKGVRRTKSRFGARVEPLSHVALLCYEGRSLDTITQADALEHFRPVREDLGRLSRGLCLLEVVDSVVQEGDEDPRLYQMLLGALRALAAGEAPLLVPAFFWKLLAQQGVSPQPRRLRHLRGRRRRGPGGVRPGGGGVLCRSCRRGRASPLTPSPCCAASSVATWWACWPRAPRRPVPSSSTWPPGPSSTTSSAACAPRACSILP